jgi:hypothetical protein
VDAFGPAGASIMSLDLLGEQDNASMIGPHRRSIAIHAMNSVRFDPRKATLDYAFAEQVLAHHGIACKTTAPKQQGDRVKDKTP